MNAKSENYGNRDSFALTELNLIGREVIPDHLNLSFKLIYDLYLEDVADFLQISKLNCSRDFYNQVLSDPKRALGERNYRKLKAYKGKLRAYSNELRDSLLKSINNGEQSIFLLHFDEPLLLDKLMELNDFDIKDIETITNTEIRLQSKNRLTSAINNFFPEIYHVKIQGRKYSIYEQIYLSDVFYDAVFRIVAKNVYHILEKSPHKPISKWFLQYFARTNGNQIAWNFPVTVAKWIYTTALKQFPDDGILYVGDTSMGWGGRLAGLLSSLSKKSDHFKRKVVLLGTDPNFYLTEKYVKLFLYWKRNINPYVNLKLKIKTVGAENVLEDIEYAKHKGKLHIVFTSPPYFNKEHYLNDSEQSFIKYPEYEDWIDNFLSPMIQNIYELLRENGHFYLNIAKIKNQGKIYDLETASIEIAERAGFRHVQTIKMLMGVTQGAARKDRSNDVINEIFINNKRYKFEPIFIFIKEKKNDSI